MKENKKMTNPIIIENLKLLLPELESMPHSDTLELGEKVKS